MASPAPALDDAGDRLERAAAAIRARAGDDPDVAWLIAAIERRPAAVRKLLARGQRGGVSADRAAALERRDDLLRRLRDRLWPALTPGAAAARMVAAFRSYESDRWPRERDGLVAPPGEPQRTFYLILRDFHAAGGPRMPDVRQLATILGE